MRMCQWYSEKKGKICDRLSIYKHVLTPAAPNIFFIAELILLHSFISDSVTLTSRETMKIEHPIKKGRESESERKSIHAPSRYFSFFDELSAFLYDGYCYARQRGEVLALATCGEPGEDKDTCTEYKVVIVGERALADHFADSLAWHAWERS